MGTLDGEDTGARSWLELSLMTIGCVTYVVLCLAGLAWLGYTLVGCMQQFSW